MPQTQPADSAQLAAITWMRQQLSDDLLPHINSSSFLELLTLAYFLGADTHLDPVQHDNPRNLSRFMQQVLLRLGYHEQFNQEKINNLLRLLRRNSLLQQFYNTGQQALSCFETKENTIQTALSQLVSQYAHYSLMDLNQFSESTHYPPAEHQPFPHKVENESNHISYVYAVLLFLTLSLGGSFLVLYFFFPDILLSIF